MTADPSALNAARRTAELTDLADGGPIDLLVIGGGVTGTGIALDAAARGLSVALVEKHDLAFGTSRWSSKLVHGGLRYLATGNVGIARRSAAERGILMTRNAPHLVRAMPQLVPLLSAMGLAERALVRTGFLAGDALRRLAGTPASTLPRSRRIGADRAVQLAPTVRRDGLDGAFLAYDGQLIDDARLVTAIARTAAQHGARILTYVAASAVTGTSARLTDTGTGEGCDVTARAVISATEIDFLLDTVNTALGSRLSTADVIGSYAGLRPLIDAGEGRTADISRDHAVIVSDSGVFSVVGGKLTEYRHMAADVLDRAVAGRGLPAGPCRTRDLPLIGAPGNPGVPEDVPVPLPPSLVARFGAEAAHVVAAATCSRPTEAVADGIDVTRAEFEYAVTHEGALTAEDILDRRTRIGLVAADRQRCVAVAEEFVATC